MGKYGDVGAQADADIANLSSQLAAVGVQLAVAQAADQADDAQIAALTAAQASLGKQRDDALTQLGAAQARVRELEALLPHDDRPTGAGFVRYEDLYKTGDTINDVLARVTDGRAVTLPQGRFEVADFAAGYLSGINIPGGCGGLIGSGRGTLGGSDGTILTMKPRSSTKAGTIPGQDNTTPQQCVLLKSLDPTTPKVVQNLQVAGTEQGHIFSLVQHYNNGGSGQRTPQDTLYQDLLLSGWDGNSGAPPGETSALAVAGPGQHTQRRVEVDGRRTVDGPVFGAMGLTHQNCIGALAEDCSVHHVRVGTFVGFQAANGIFRRITADSVTGITNGLGNGGLNFERTAGYVVDSAKITGRQRKVHVTHSNDHFTLNLNGKTYVLDGGPLTFIDPSWNDLWSPDEKGGFFYIQSWGPYGNGSTMTYPTTAPVVKHADGTHITYKYVASDGRGLVS